MFKNEAPWLKEWILYHHQILGVEHFYLYNNDSTDNYREVLQPFIDQHIVELIDWSSDDPTHHASGAYMDAPWSASQLGSYNHCLKKAKGEAKWVAMIDIDEFIVPVKKISRFYHLLDKAQKDKIGAVCLHWRVFGTSDVNDLAPGEYLMEKLTWRSLDNHGWNQHVKSIYQPEGVSSCLVHVPEKLSPGFGLLHLKAKQVRLHHYWFRTNKHSLEKRKMSASTHPDFFKEFHQKEDRSALPYVSDLKKLNPINQDQRGK